MIIIRNISTYTVICWTGITKILSRHCIETLLLEYVHDLFCIEFQYRKIMFNITNKLAQIPIKCFTGICLIIVAVFLDFMLQLLVSLILLFLMISWRFLMSSCLIFILLLILFFNWLIFWNYWRLWYWDLFCCVW